MKTHLTSTVKEKLKCYGKEEKASLKRSSFSYTGLFIPPWGNVMKHYLKSVHIWN